MDFGKLDDITNVDFTLPPDGPLLFEPTQKPLEVYIGPPIWANKAWVGKIYPYKAKDADFLYHYSRQFNTIELNVTHYNIPSDETLKKWLEAVPPEFKFCPKFNNVISHEKQLLGAKRETDYFVEQISKMGNNLGTTFLQLPPYFSSDKLLTLINYLTTLPQDFPVTVEFRHPSWFEDATAWNTVIYRLKDLGIGTVMTDVSGRRDVLHMSFPTPELTLRFVGNELHPTDYTRTTEWVNRMVEWRQKGLEKAWIFIHTEDNDTSPELTNFWIKELNEKLQLTLKPAVIQPKAVQGSLF